MEHVHGTIVTTQTAVDQVKIGNWIIEKQEDSLVFFYNGTMQFMMKPGTS